MLVETRQVAIAALAALAQYTRLAIFRVLVYACPSGSAGRDHRRAGI